MQVIRVKEKMRRSLCLSHILNESAPAYGGQRAIRIIHERRLSEGSSANTQRWELLNHLGTHVDAPRHFFDEGKAVDEFPPEFWACSNTALIDVPLERARWIEPDDLASCADRTVDCILIRTGFQKFRSEDIYLSDNPGLSPETAKWLRANFTGLKFVGIDFISVSRFQDRQKGREAHRAFLDPKGTGNQILPVEDMDLAALPVGAKIISLLIAPVRVAGTDGSPVTVFAQFEVSKNG